MKPQDWLKLKSKYTFSEPFTPQRDLVVETIMAAAMGGRWHMAQVERGIGTSTIIRGMAQFLVAQEICKYPVIVIPSCRRYRYGKDEPTYVTFFGNLKGLAKPIGARVERPDLVIFDSPQRLCEAKSLVATENAMHDLHYGFANLAGPGRGTQMAYFGTVLAPDDLTTRLLDCPEWRKHKLTS